MKLDTGCLLYPVRILETRAFLKERILILRRIVSTNSHDAAIIYGWLPWMS